MRCERLSFVDLPRFAILVGALTAALLIASGAPAAAQLKMIYRFHNGSNGAYPSGGLAANAAGNLYGTTASGGNSGGYDGLGTVFELSPPANPTGTWTQITIYAFSNTGDGAIPLSGVILDSAGNLYGTTVGSGSGDTVFELSPPATPGASWTETTLYTLDPVSYPHGLVFDAHGNLYGMTEYGGKYGRGTAYELSPPAAPAASWTETLLYDFTGGHDGAYPQAGLVFDRGGNLYGTATEGGIIKDCHDTEMYIGCGVVFQLSPNSNGPWTEPCSTLSSARRTP
jgi:uncharacterized repeat protein (TIGR03803 family)